MNRSQSVRLAPVNIYGCAGSRTCSNTLGLNLAHIDGGWTLRALLDREFDLVTFGEAAETLGHDGGLVDKHVLAAFHRQKAIPLLVVEPFDGADNTFAAHCTK